MALRRNPSIYEIHTAVWLTELSRRYGRPVTLGDIPAEVIDELVSWGFDAVWMMGVWERSPRAREIGLKHPDLMAEYTRVLPGWTPDQVPGSPYAVHRYTADSRFGGRDWLATFRQALKDRGSGLILHLVPNHVAVAHPCTDECTACLVRGTQELAGRQPRTYFQTPENRLI